MKRTARLLLAFLLVAVPTAQESTTRESPLNAEIIAVERERVSALVKGEVPAIEKLFAANYVQVTPDGSLRRKADVVSGMRLGALKFDSIQNGNLLIIVNGNTAVVTGISSRKGKDGTNDLSGRFRFSRTWVKEEADWKLLSQQSTPIPASK